MGLTAGSVAIDEGTEAVTGAGLALALYEADAATMSFPVDPALDSTAQPYSVERPANASDIALMKAARVRLKQELARKATARAVAIAPKILGFDASTFTAIQSADYVANPGEYVECNTFSAPFNVDLPSPSTALIGAHVWVKKVVPSANAVTVRLNGGSTIDTLSDVSAGVLFLCDGFNWLPSARY
jgi:hypothetical protein